MDDLRKLLRQGYVVEHMDGELSKVEMNAGKQLIISGEHRWFPIENLTEQLEYICYFTNDKDYAPKVKIKTIYGLAEVNCKAFKLSTDDREIIWEREKGSMKFNWKEFKASDNIAVHCKTQEEATDFCKQMHEQGMKWMRGTSYLEKNNWEDEKEETCYEADGTYQSKNYYDERDYYILEWSNYMNEEKENNMNLELNNLTEEQKQQIIELAKKFEQENEVDKLDYDNDYTAINGVLDFPRKFKLTVCEFKDQFFDLGLTAHTKEEAEKIRRRLLVEKKLRDLAKKCKEPVDWEKEQDKCCIAYVNNTKKIILDDFCNYTIGNIIFTDSKIGKQAIESIGQERLIRDYFGIE